MVPTQIECMPSDDWWKHPGCWEHHCCSEEVIMSSSTSIISQTLPFFLATRHADKAEIMSSLRPNKVQVPMVVLLCHRNFFSQEWVNETSATTCLKNLRLQNPFPLLHGIDVSHESPLKLNRSCVSSPDSSLSDKPFLMLSNHIPFGLPLLFPGPRWIAQMS